MTPSDSPAGEPCQEARAGFFFVEKTVDLPSAAETLASSKFDVVLLDSELPESRSAEAVCQFLDRAILPVIVVSSCHIHSGDPEECIKIGQQYYHFKGQVAEALLIGAIIYAQSRAQVQNELWSCRRDLRESTRELESAHLQLIHAEKMEALGQLAAGVAHEVKNPLARIVLGADYLAQTDLSKDENLPEILSNIREAAQSANDIIRGMVDISSASELQIESEDLNDVVRKGALMIQHELILHDIDLQLDLCHNLTPALIDAAKIEQVLINLYLNAIHAMEDGPNRQLRISTGSEEVTATEGGGAQWLGSQRFRPGGAIAVIRVEDEGRGLPGVPPAQVFEPFFTTKPAGKGTGLGLTVCAKIIDLHHGRITLENRSECGVVATIRLPHANSAEV